MVQLETSIEIGAGAARVWGILTDFAAYPGWNPFIRSTEGKPVIGDRLSVTIKPEGGSAMSFKPRVLRKGTELGFEAMNQALKARAEEA